MMGIFILILFILVIAVVVYQQNVSRTPQQLIRDLKDAKLIYNGEKEAGYFSSYNYKIRAKPDFMYQHEDGSISIVEYKSRQSGVKQSDISQLIATAIAVKDEIQHNVKFGYVLTKGGSQKKINLDRSSNDLIRDIWTVLKEARDILNGAIATPNPTRQKCSGCGFRRSCKYAK